LVNPVFFKAGFFMSKKEIFGIVFLPLYICFMIAKETQVQLVLLAANGFPNREISDRTKLSVRTVEKYIATIREEHKARSIAHLVHIFHQKKLIK